MKADLDPIQPELPLVDVHLNRCRGAELIESCRSIAVFHGWDRAAKELDASFNPEGRSVSSGVLRQALTISERNYARMEWLPYFAAISDEPAQVVASAAGKTLTVHGKLKPEDELELLKERVMREFGTAGARLVMNTGGRRR